MKYQELGEDYKFRVGEAVWIVTSSPSHRWPDGIAWKGEVVAVHEEKTSENGYKRLRAKIVDERLREVDDGYHFDREPFESYDVYPRGGTHIDKLIDWVERLRRDVATSKYEQRIREEAIRGLFVAVHEGHAKEAAKEAFERGVKKGIDEAREKAKAHERAGG